MSLHLRDARITRAVASAARGDALILDLNGDNAALAVSGFQQNCQSIIHAADQLAEWEVAVALRPPSVRGFELAVAQLLEDVGGALDEGWRGSCTACGQPLRIAAWRWEGGEADADPRRLPTARRATCAACKGLGKRGDASAMRPGEAATLVQLDAAVHDELTALLGADLVRRWTPRQLHVFAALQRAIARSTEATTPLTALRVAVTQAALRSARPESAGAQRPWWEVAPWQALAEAVDQQRRQLLLAEELPRDLTLSGDLVTLGYPGRSVILTRGGAAVRSAAIALGATGGRRAALVRLRLGDHEPARELRRRASALAGGAEGAVDTSTLVNPESTVAVAAAIARLVVALDPLMSDGASLLIEIPELLPSLAGSLSAASMASGRVSSIERFTREDGVSCWSISIVIPPARERGGRSVTRKDRGALSGEPLERIVADLVVARGEPTTAKQILPLYALHRSASGELLESGQLLDEFNELFALRDRLRPIGSVDRLVSAAGGRIFIDGRAERERLAQIGGDADDAALWAVASAGGSVDTVPEGDRELTAALREAYFTEGDAAGEEEGRPRWPGGDRAAARAEQVHLLLKVGAAMGLHTAVGPALADTVINGTKLGAQVARDPIDSSPPLRHRSDRIAFDQIDALLFRRGKSLFMCEVKLGPLPLGDLLLNRHSKVATDREVVRLLITERPLLALVALRLARDERLAAAWEEQNWHLLATDQLALLARLPAPRLNDLERYLGSAPPERGSGAQLDLTSAGWSVAPQGPIDPVS